MEAFGQMLFDSVCWLIGTALKFHLRSFHTISELFDGRVLSRMHTVDESGIALTLTSTTKYSSSKRVKGVYMPRAAKGEALYTAFCLVEQAS